MKLKNIQYYIAIIVFMTTQLYPQNTNPEVTNVAFDISGTTVTVTYNVTDAVQTTVTIIMQVSSDNGVTWDFNYGTATGDIGASVAIGTGKTITWTYSGVYNPNFKIRIYANDETAGGSTCPGVATVNYGEKTYNTIQIGTQCWLKENLDIGTMINSTDGSQTNNGIIEKYCYNNLAASCITYGGLYQWDEAMQYVNISGAQGICPTGWHIPTLAEFTILSATVGDNGNTLTALGQGTGTNTSGFSALLAGYRGHNGNFGNLGGYAFFWSSTEGGATSAYYVILVATSSDVGLGDIGKESGFSVRCLKD